MHGEIHPHGCDIAEKREICFLKNFYLKIKKVFEIRFDLTKKKVATQGSSFQTFINKKVQVKQG